MAATTAHAGGRRRRRSPLVWSLGASARGGGHGTGRPWGLPQTAGGCARADSVGAGSALAPATVERRVDDRPASRFWRQRPWAWACSGRPCGAVRCNQCSAALRWAPPHRARRTGRASGRTSRPRQRAPAPPARRLPPRALCRGGACGSGRGRCAPAPCLGGASRWRGSRALAGPSARCGPGTCGGAVAWPSHAGPAGATARQAHARHTVAAAAAPAAAAAAAAAAGRHSGTAARRHWLCTYHTALHTTGILRDAGTGNWLWLAVSRHTRNTTTTSTTTSVRGVCGPPVPKISPPFPMRQRPQPSSPSPSARRAVAPCVSVSAAAAAAAVATRLWRLGPPVRAADADADGALRCLRFLLRPPARARARARRRRRPRPHVRGVPLFQPASSSQQPQPRPRCSVPAPPRPAPPGPFSLLRRPMPDPVATLPTVWCSTRTGPSSCSVDSVGHYGGIHSV